jgi:malonyl-CoA O-methyltransferase
MSMRKAAVRHRFSEKANLYDKYALVQQEMARRLAESVGSMANPPVNILEIGCGTGYLTKLMREQFPDADYQALDIAPGMLERARARLEAEKKSCQFVLADVEEWVTEQPEQSCDLILSNACFQWLLHPAVTLAHLRRLLRPYGQLLFTTFGPRTFYELHDSFAAAYEQLGKEPERHGLSFCSPEGWEQMMIQAGFAKIGLHRFERVMYYPDVLRFLHAVKQIGASTSEAKPAPGLGERRLMMEMMRHYDIRYRTNSGIPVTYDIVLVTGVRRKPLFVDDLAGICCE